MKAAVEKKAAIEKKATVEWRPPSNGVCFFDRLATKENREGAERPNKRMAACDGRSPKKRNKARGKRRQHRLAVDQSMDRSFAKK